MRVAALDHERGHDAVPRRAVVDPRSGAQHEVRHVDGAGIGVGRQLGRDRAEVHRQDDARVLAADRLGEPQDLLLG